MRSDINAVALFEGVPPISPAPTRELFAGYPFFRLTRRPLYTGLGVLKICNALFAHISRR